MKKFTTAMIALTCLTILMLGASGCTDNARTKTFGGKMTINLPSCQKLTTATWKNTNLFYLTRPFRAGEVAETSIFQENSNFGVVEGTVFFVESCQK